MGDKKPARQSIRLPQYDYSGTGYYFITLCTNERQSLFGEIIDGRMILNSLGKIIRAEWVSVVRYYNGRVLLDIFVIMPNHFHAIVILNPDIKNIVGVTLAVARDVSNQVDIIQSRAPGYRAGTSPAPTLGDVVGAFKSRCFHEWYLYVKNNNLCNAPLKIWQRNYYEHIIRDEKDYENIWQYIAYNPAKWDWDRNNPKNF